MRFTVRAELWAVSLCVYLDVKAVITIIIIIIIIIITISIIINLYWTTFSMVYVINL